jgi:lipid II:glycine glycyltransferase (peptidoglycan interpeptide bridge formation enzyme)
MLSVLPRAFPGPKNWQFEHLMARGFRRGSGLLFPNRYIVKLGLSEAEQRKSFGQKWRYHLGKAEKAGLSFERGEPEAIREFDALYAAMSDRKNFPDHSAYETIGPLLAAECGKLRPELFFVRHAGEIVAGAVIFKAGDTAVYLFGATNDRALPLRAGYFMHARIIGWLTENTDAKWYDLGGTDGFQGLHQFKKGMVGSAGVISPVPPAANCAARPLPLNVGTAAFAARDGYHHLRRLIETRFGDKAKPDQTRSAAGDE